MEITDALRAGNRKVTWDEPLYADFLGCEDGLALGLDEPAEDRADDDIHACEGLYLLLDTVFDVPNTDLDTALA